MNGASILLYYILLLAVGCLASKFRMEKLNYIWSKIDESSLDQKRLLGFRTALEKFDALYLSQKQDDQHRKVKSPSLKEIDTKLESLLERYDLDAALKAFRIKYKYEREKVYQESNLRNTVHDRHTVFDDPRVEKLWLTAKNDDELVIDELDDIYDRLKILDSKIGQYHDVASGHKEERGNAIEVDDSHAAELAFLKSLNAEIEAGLQDIRDILTGVRDSPFTEVKAKKLWAKAKLLKEPSETLASLRSDIRQYEKLLMRVSHHSSVLSDTKKLLATGGSKDKEGEFLEAEELSDIVADQEKLEAKLRKYEKYVTERIQKLVDAGARHRDEL